MTYVSGTLSNAASATAFMAVLDASIIAEPGLSKVSSAVVAGSNTWNVYKSAGTNNSFGVDFFFAIGRPTSAPTTILIALFEGWSTGTLKATSYPPTATTLPDANFANPAAALALPSTGATMAHLKSAVITTNCSYYFSVSADRVILSIRTSNSVDIGFYIGLYDSFNTSVVDPFPICAVNLNVPYLTSFGGGSSNTLTSGVTTREPGIQEVYTDNFSVFCGGGASSSWTRIEGGNDVYKGFSYLSRALLSGRYSGYRGLLKDIYLGPVQAQNGDSVTWTLAGVTRTAIRAAGNSLGLYFLSI